MDLHSSLAFFSGIAVMACAFLAAYFIFIKKGTENILLGGVFLAMGLRIGKSVFYYLMPDVSLLGVAFGFLGLSSIGPLTLFYSKIYSGKSFQWNWQFSIHFLIPLFGFLAIAFALVNVRPSTFYKSSTLIFGAYLFYTGFYLIRNQYWTSWTKWLFFSILMVFGAFVYQHQAGSMSDYVFGTAIAFLIYYATTLFYA